MRVSFLVYGVLYVAFEIVGNQLEKVGWPKSPRWTWPRPHRRPARHRHLHRARRRVDLGRERWGPALRAWNEERLRLAAEAAEEAWAEVVWDDEPIGVRSWRPEPLALPAAAARPPAGTYYTPSTPSPPFPEEPGPQL